MSVQGRSRLDVPALPDAATSTAADLVQDLQENIPHPTLNLQIFSISRHLGDVFEVSWRWMFCKQPLKANTSKS